MHRFLFAIALLSAGSLRAQSPSTDTDVYVAPITRIGDSIVVGRPVNATHRAGYDNQPSFTRDSRSVYYTAQSNGQTDIWRYDLAARRSRRLTNTPESEYSAKQIPGGTHFTVVRVERDSTQRLWSFTGEGTDPRVVLPGLKPVGYHTWIGPTTLAAYVLGSPSTLHLAERDGSYDVVVSKDVGRSLESVPLASGALFSFTQRGYQDRPGIFVFSGRSDTTRFVHEVVSVSPQRRGVLAETKRTTVVDSVVIAMKRPYQLVGMSPDNEYHTWTPDGTLLTTVGSVLMRWSGVLDAGSMWIPVADLKPFGVKNVSRLAFSPDGNWLAFVAEPVR
jgi:hypothetical protein